MTPLNFKSINQYICSYVIKQRSLKLNWSYEYWSRRLDQKVSACSLKHIVSGRRLPTLQQLTEIARGQNLNSIEFEYLNALLEIAKVKLDNEVKDFLNNNLQSFFKEKAENSIPSIKVSNNNFEKFH